VVRCAKRGFKGFRFKGFRVKGFRFLRNTKGVEEHHILEVTIRKVVVSISR
jgi:hypothetical protein